MTAQRTVAVYSRREVEPLYPTSFLIDAEGTILVVGGLSEDRSQHLEEMLQSMTTKH
jgi:hypothetical protein